MKQLFVSAGLLISFLLLSPVTAAAPDTGKQQSPLVAAPTGNAARPLPFKPGDALKIIPYPDTAGFPAGFYSVDGEGFVDFPIIGYVKVTGMSCEGLAKLLAEKYVDFMKYPHMTIRPLIRVALSGGFYRPGLYWVNPHASLWEALQIAGGTTRPDGFKKLKWERSNTIVNNDLVPIIQEGKSLYQIGFETGDQITVLQQPQRTGWELFSTNVLPMFTFAISTAVSVLTIYSSMQMYESYRSGQ
jgi:protein involved in polysaccharide export with SLBB domain